MTGMTKADDAETVADGGDVRTLARLWALAVAFGLLTVGWSLHVGVPFRDPDGVVLRNRIVISVLLFGLLVVVDAVVRTGRRGWTAGGAVAALRARWPRRRVALAVSALLAYHLVYACYRNLKSWAAFRPDHDDRLERVDTWLFLGHNPAVLLHDLIGQQAAPVLAAVYESFATLVSISLVAALALAPRLRDGLVFLASAMWLWVLGVGSYYLIPSLGPFATAPRDFAHLPDTIITSKQATLLVDRSALLHDPGASGGFASISAFASLHVAFTCLILLMMRYYGLRWAMWAMSVVFATTALATIYFGWHFVVDDVAGVALAVLALRLGRLMIGDPGPSPD